MSPVYVDVKRVHFLNLSGAFVTRERNLISESYRSRRVGAQNGLARPNGLGDAGQCGRVYERASSE